MTKPPPMDPAIGGFLSPVPPDPSREWLFWEHRTLNLHRVVAHWDPPFIPADAPSSAKAVRSGIGGHFRVNFFRGLAFGVVIETDRIFLSTEALVSLIDTAKNRKGVWQWVVLSAPSEGRVVGVHTWLENYLSPVYRRLLRAHADAGFACESIKKEKGRALGAFMPIARVVAAIHKFGLGSSAYPEFQNKW